MNNKEFNQYLRDNSQIKINNRISELQVDNYLPENKRLRNYRLPMIRILTSAVILIFLFTGLYLNFNPTAKITLEFNPYVEFEVNLFNRVIGVSQINDSGEEMLSAIDPKFQKIDKVIHEIYEYGKENELAVDDSLYAIVNIETNNNKQKSNITNIINSETNLKPLIMANPQQTLEFDYEASITDSNSETVSGDSAYDQLPRTYTEVLEEHQVSELYLNIVYAIFARNPELQSPEYLDSLLTSSIQELYDIYYLN